VRRPKVHDESRTLGLDRNELGALLVQAGLGDPRDEALITLLALNGLRISEALNADIGDLSTERGHRTLAIVRKGGKHITIPIAPRIGRAIDLYIAERTVGPIGVGCRKSFTEAAAQRSAIRGGLPAGRRGKRGVEGGTPRFTVVTTRTMDGRRGVELNPNRTGGSTGASSPRSAPDHVPLTRSMRWRSVAA